MVIQRPSSTPLAMAPLVAHFRLKYPGFSFWEQINRMDFTDREIFSLRRLWAGGFREGGLSLESADLVACKVLKIHPALIWPEWFEFEVVPPRRPRNRLGKPLTARERNIITNLPKGVAAPGSEGPRLFDELAEVFGLNACMVKRARSRGRMAPVAA